jgi:hypothetical protein
MQLTAENRGGKHLVNPARRGIDALQVLALLILALIALMAPSVEAQAQSSASENRMRAAYLYHFSQLIQWPVDAMGNRDHPFLFCTIDDDPLHGELDAAVEGKSMGKRPLQVLHLKQKDSLADCRILYIGKNQSKIGDLLARVRLNPIVTIGDSDRFIEQGGMIRLGLENDRLRFDINLDRAEATGVQISSRLLLLARSVVSNH